MSAPGPEAHVPVAHPPVDQPSAARPAAAADKADPQKKSATAKERASMDLILWRHAEAEGESGGPDDLDRALTTKGERQAQRVAAWLHQRLPEGTRILASPAKRTQQTVRALTEMSNRKARTIDAIGPHATAEDLLTAADWPHSRQPVLIVGHQPALGEVAAWLIGGEAQAWSVRKGAVWWIRQRLRAEVAQNVLVAVQSPELL